MSSDVEGFFGTTDVREVGRQRLRAADLRLRERYEQAIATHEHLWIATVGYYVTVPVPDGQLLDADSIALTPAVSCFICEQGYVYGMSHICPGEPA